MHTPFRPHIWLISARAKAQLLLEHRIPHRDMVHAKTSLSLATEALDALYHREVACHSLCHFWYMGHLPQALLVWQFYSSQIPLKMKIGAMRLCEKFCRKPEEATICHASPYAPPFVHLPFFPTHARHKTRLLPQLPTQAWPLVTLTRHASNCLSKIKKNCNTKCPLHSTLCPHGRPCFMVADGRGLGGKKIALQGGGGGGMNAHFPNPPPLLGRRVGTIVTECQRGWYFCLRVVPCTVTGLHTSLTPHVGPEEYTPGSIAEIAVRMRAGRRGKGGDSFRDQTSLPRAVCNM